MNITWFSLDIEQIEGGDKAFSFEYIREGFTHKLTAYFPTFIFISKARIEE
jgi:hypothetical protein